MIESMVHQHGIGDSKPKSIEAEDQDDPTLLAFVGSSSITDLLPSWVVFPDIERAEWVNDLSHRAWPTIGKIITNKIRHIVEPKVNEIY